MQLVDLEQGSDEWLEFRLGKITGTRLGSIWAARQYTKDDIVKLLSERGVEFKKSLLKKDLDALLTDEDKAVLSSDAEKKLEFYQILADQVAVAPAEEDGGRYDMGDFIRSMDRGVDKEGEALAKFAELTGKKLARTGCIVADADPRIINSPDSYVVPAPGEPITEEVEAKCLASAKHLMAYFERRIPDEYWTQKVQYFVTNEQLQTLYWVFYDPRIPMLPLFVLVVRREDLGHWPETMLKYQLRTVKEIDQLTVRLLEESDNVILPARPEV